MPETLEVDRPVRADIQGLRAIAVGSVLLAHFWPAVLPGGWMGVDVFFVVSGYLITARILRDLEQHRPGSFLARFWAARVRRILPAAMLVAGVVLLTSASLVPATRWPAIGSHVLAASVSLENWQLASEAVQYGAQGATPSPMQHYWSLGVEEQFYVLWPLLLMAATLAARRLLPARRRRLALGLVMAAVITGSFGYSLVVTWSETSAAYFITPARLWELAAGGLLALSAPRAGRTAAWIGLAVIGTGFALFDLTTPYPGWAALVPVLGTCLVIVADRTAPLSFDHVAGWRPLQWLGNVSYSVYLWHWPLLVLTTLALAREPTTREKLLLVALTLVLAHATFHLVEQPLRHGWVLRTPSRAWAAGLLAMSVMATSAYRFEDAGHDRLRVAMAQFAAEVERGGPCLGAAALDHRCADPYAPVSRAAALSAATDQPLAVRRGCSDTIGPFSTVLCRLGDPHGRRTVLVWGNSHAAAWSDAADAAGKQLRMRVLVASRSSCPATLLPPPHIEGRRASAEDRQACAQRNRWVLRELVPRADLVVLADYRGDFLKENLPVTGYVRLVETLRRRGVPTVWLRDVPLPGTVTEQRDGPDCLRVHGQCTNERDRATQTQRVSDELHRRVPDLDMIDTRSRFCDAQECYAAVGGLPVYKDTTHLTGTFSRSLGPWLARQIRTRVDRGGGG